MAGRNLHNAYLDTQVKTASKDQLLMMLFDGAIKFAHQAKISIEARNIEAIATNAVKVQNIVNELMGSLDKDMINAELYGNLMSLYAFVHKRMIAANVERSPVACDEAIEILHKLRSIWKEAIDKVLAENGGKLPAMGERPPAAAPIAQATAATTKPSPTLAGAASQFTPGGGYSRPGAMPTRPLGAPTPAFGRSAPQQPQVAASAGGNGATAAFPPAAPRPAIPAPGAAPAQTGQKFPLPAGAALAAAATQPRPAAPAPAAPAAGMAPPAPRQPAPAPAADAKPASMRPKITLGKK